MSKIVIYNSNGELLRHLYQWDTNQVIVVEGATPASSASAHLTDMTRSIRYDVKAEFVDDKLSFKIPDMLLEQSGQIIAYLYVENEDGSTRTTHTINIPVVSRPKPLDYEYAPSDNKGAVIVDEDTGIKYVASIKIQNGKPTIVYEEVANNV